MTSTLAQLPPEGMLSAAVDALLAEEPAELDPQVALCRARVVLHESERLAAAALAAIADLDERELFALDGAGSTRGWLRQQPAGDQGQMSLARRLRARAVVRGALESGTIDTRAATSVRASLASVDELEAGSGLGGGIGEDQVHGVLVNAVPDTLRAWTGFADAVDDGLPDDEPSPAPSPSPSQPVTDERDGLPGWQRVPAGTGGCTPVVRPPLSYGAPAPDLRLELSAPPGGSAAGSPLTVRWTVTNAGDRPVELSYLAAGDPRAAWVTGRGVAVAMTYGSDGSGSFSTRVLAPGARPGGSAPLISTTCGDTSQDPEVPVPAGEYRAVFCFAASADPDGDAPRRVGADQRWCVTSAPFALS